jgi:methylase of polypeptide subunit release factors
LTPEGNLSSQEKKRILLNNIFGVDIDTQAVEVTKLSLLLKSLEGETETSIETSLKLFNERVLPTIDGNIQCGNSLISPDFYTEQLFLTPKEERQINVFDWKTSFPDVFKQNGFDCIIGNPPYILLQILEKKEIFNYTSKKYNSAHYKIDTYQLFIENSVNLLKPDGYLAYITPNTFLKNIHSEPLRRFILENTVIKEFLLFYYGVFDQASVDVCISLVKRSKVNGKNIIKVKEAHEIFKPILKREIEQTSFHSNNRLTFNISIDNNEKELIDKITKNTNPLSKYCSAYFGIQTWDRKKYVSTSKLNENYQPIIDGGNIDRYTLKPAKEYVLFIPEAIKSGGKEKIYLQDRLCTRQIGNYPLVTFVEGGIFALNTIYNIYKTNETTDLKFILGIINSKVINYFWKKTNYDEKKTFPKIKKEAILNIPIPDLDLTNKTVINQYEQIIKLVDTILDLNKRLLKANLQNEKDQLKRRIDFTNNEIDNTVYSLFKLTDNEKQIIKNLS